MKTRYLWIRFGRNGRQLARVVAAHESELAYVVQKFRANSNRWTGNLKVVRSQVLGDASASDAAVVCSVAASRQNKVTV